MTEDEASRECDRIRQIAYELHVYLGVGYLEKIYERGLAYRLEKAGFDIKTQVPIQIRDEDGFLLGEYVVDMIVNGIIIELKSVSMIVASHIAQTINYLVALNIDYGFLINFGSERFESRKLKNPKKYKKP